MATLVELEGMTPDVADDVYVAPTATMIGNVTVHAGASVWFGSVMRADFDRIVIGEGSAVQDNAVLHCAPDMPTLVGKNVIVGHGAMLEGCTVEDGVVLGMGCIVLQRAHVGEGAMIGAGAVVKEGQEIPADHLAVGAPAKVVKELSGSSADWVAGAGAAYQQLMRRYAAHAIVHDGTP